MRSSPPPDPDGSPDRGRSSLRLLIDPVFGPFFAGKLLATGGIWIYNIVAAILAYELSGSAFVVGLVSVAQFGPQLLFAPLSGAMADRGDRRRQLIVGRVIAAAGSGGLAIWIWLVGVDGLPGAWPVVLTALIVGFGFVIGGPAMNALIPALVRPNELATAIALSSVPFTIARAGGPAVGALVAIRAGPAVAFGIAAATNLIWALLLLPLRVRPRVESGGDRRVRAVLSYLREDRGLQLLLVGVTAIGVGADPVITLTPSLSAVHGAGSTLVGIFASSFGVGAGMAFLILTYLRLTLGLGRLGTLGLLCLAAGCAGAGLSPSPEPVIVYLGIAGAGMTMSLTSLSTQIQERSPEHLRARVMALWAVAFLGSRPIAAAANGAIADVASPGVAFVAVAVFVGVIAWFARPSRLGRYPSG